MFIVMYNYQNKLDILCCFLANKKILQSFKLKVVINPVNLFIKQLCLKIIKFYFYMYLPLNNCFITFLVAKLLYNYLSPSVRMSDLGGNVIFSDCN